MQTATVTVEFSDGTTAAYVDRDAAEVEGVLLGLGQPDSMRC